MNIKKRLLTLVVSLTAIIGIPQSGYGDKGDYRAVFFTLEPVEHPDSAGPVAMKFEFTIKDDFCNGCKCCDEVRVQVIPMSGLQYHGEKSWIARPNLSEDNAFSTVLHITLPPNDTSSLRIILGLEQARVPAHVYFVTTEDTVEFWKGPPSRSYWDRPWPAPDTTRYKVKIDLRKPEHFEFIKQYEDSVGPIQATSDSGFYIIKVTRYWFDDLMREGFKCEYLTEPPPWPSGRPGAKGTLRKVGGDDDGCERPKPERDEEALIWLDRVDGEDENGRLPANKLIRFVLGLANHTGDSLYGIANGFRLYSPDGAVWDTTMPETIPPLEWNEAFDGLLSFYYKSLTGSGADSIKIVGMTVFGTGLQNGFDDTAIALTIGPIDPDDVGKTVCIDSSYVSGTSNWYWSSSDGMTLYYPAWYGPHCFEITEQGYFYFWGQFRYVDPTPPDTIYRPIREALVYMWDADPGNDDFLDSTFTDNSGFYGFGPLSSDDWLGPDIYFTSYAMNDGAHVTDSLDGSVYMIWSDTMSNVSGGDYEYNKDLTVEESRAFFVADVILDGYKTWRQLRPNPDDHPWGPVQVVLGKGPENASYYKADRYIYVNDSVDNIQRWPDTWNRSTILHEYAHRQAHMLLLVRNGGGSHTVYTLAPLGTSSSEGWAHFWSAFVLESPVAVDYWNDFYDSSWANWENGEFDLVPYTGSANAMGKYNETAVAGMLWDVLDNIDDDYSSQSDWGDTARPHTPDNIGDSLSDGIGNILSVLLDRQVDGHRPDNIDEFWQAWFSEPTPGHGKAMEDIWFEHGEVVTCCADRGNVDHVVDGGIPITVADQTYLVAALFAGGPPPPCEEEGNVDDALDGEFAITVSDLTYLVAYMFVGGPSPPA